MELLNFFKKFLKLLLKYLFTYPCKFYPPKKISLISFRVGHRCEPGECGGELDIWLRCRILQEAWRCRRQLRLPLRPFAISHFHSLAPRKMANGMREAGAFTSRKWRKQPQQLNPPPSSQLLRTASPEYGHRTRGNILRESAGLCFGRKSSSHGT